MKPTLGRCWARYGIRPRTLVKPAYRNFYLYASVSPHSGESFMLFLPWVNTQIMNLYLQQLTATYQDQEIILIMDRAGWHQASELVVPANLTIIFLPPYSPELNPTEKLWQCLRRHVCRNRLFKSEDELIEALEQTINHMSPQQLATLCHCSYL